MKKLPLLFGVVFLMPASAHACTIPVFRYALEKWDLTPYEVIVFHRGALPNDVKKTLDLWGKPGKANIDITLVDLDGKVDAKMKKLWEQQKKAEAPWMLIRYPVLKAESVTTWAGPCTNANLLAVFDSPMRQTIIEHLKGGSSVFVLLASGDKKADKAAYDLTLAELQNLEKKVKLPVQSKEGPQLRLPIPLKVSLPLLVLDRTRPEEAAFIKMLLATEDDLEDIKGPILFAIFGRGRVLGSVYDKELNAEQIGAITKFLCRECSCQVKELNPGVDMLLAADWNAIFDKMFDGEKKVEPNRIEFKNIQPRDGPKGEIRKDKKVAAGAAIYFSYEIEGLSVGNQSGKVSFETKLEILAPDRLVFKITESKQVAANGKAIAEICRVDVPVTLQPGRYTVRLTVQDKLDNSVRAFQTDIDVIAAK